MVCKICKGHKDAGDDGRCSLCKKALIASSIGISYGKYVAKMYEREMISKEKNKELYVNEDEEKRKQDNGKRCRYCFGIIENPKRRKFCCEEHSEMYHKRKSRVDMYPARMMIRFEEEET